MELNLFASAVHAVGTLLAAALLWQLTRIIRGGFLAYWAFAWVALAVALFALHSGVTDRLPVAVRRLGLSAYCGGAYAFGFLLWAGFRNFTRDRHVTRADFYWFGPLLAFGLAFPQFLPRYAWLLPLHGPVFAALLGLSYWETVRHRPTGWPTVGLSAVRGLLLGLAVLFLHYGPVVYFGVYLSGEEYPYLQLAPVYDALVELGLAFGLVVLAAERGRDELDAKNRELAEYSQKLAEAARTDALTGLLNRRAFDDLPRSFADRPFAGTLAVLDLNNLKPLNDRNGHPAGDAALQTVARALRNGFRVTDPLFRIGGDEFVVVVEDLTEADLAGRMARVDGALASVRLPGLPDAVPLTLAWGVAGFASAAEFGKAYERADRVMYANKVESKSRAAG